MNLSTRLTVAMVALVLLTAGAIGLLTYRTVETTILPGELDRIATHARFVAAELQSTTGGARADVVGFRAAVALAGIVRANLAGGTDPRDGTSEARWRKELAARFRAELATKPSYLAFRIIGLADGGRELVRVERSTTDGSIRRIPDADLPQQGDRDYFKKAIGLNDDQVYVSPVERVPGTNGGAALPVLRVASPVFAPDGRPFGIVIIDVDMRPAFAAVRVAASQNRRIFVVDEQGNYLVHPDPGREFAFETGRTERWQQDFPELAAVWAPGQAGARTTHDRAGDRLGAAIKSVRLADGPQVSVLETLPYADLMAPALAVERSGLIAAGAAVLCAFGLAGILARSLTRPLSAMTRAVEEFAQDRTIPVPIGAGGEIGVLSRAFSRMVTEVRDKTAALSRETEERQRTETALERHADRERLFSAAVESSDDAIVTKTLDGVITGWNPAAERLFGRSATEVIGQSIEIIVPEDRRLELRDILGRVSRGERIEHFETVRTAKDGRRIDVSLSVSPVRSASGAIIGASKTARDITQHRQAQSALRQEIEERRLVFETSLDLILVTDGRGNFLNVSPIAAEILGYRPEEMIGRNASEFLFAEDLEGARDEMRKARRGRAMRNFECRYVRRDGRIVNLTWTGVWSEPVQKHFFSGRDMTEQKLAEEKFRLAVDASPSGIVMIDAAGKIVLVNAETERMFGYARDELLGQPVDILVPIAMRGPHARHRAEFLARPEARRMGSGRELYGLRKDGSDFPVEIGLNPIDTPSGRLVLGMIVDITESRKAQEALLDSERMARGIIDTALDAFVQMDESGKVVDWNPQAEAIFGWPRADAIGKNMGDLIVPERHRARHTEGLRRFLQTGEGAILGKRLEIEALRRDGKEITVELSVTALRRRGANVFNGFIRDLTERMAADEHLRQAQKMETVGQLTGGIAHDFNNILTVITGTIEILAEGVAGKPGLVEIAKMIDEAATRGAELTQRLLAFARRQPLQPRRTDINALIVDAAKLLRPTLGEHVEIEAIFAEDAWPGLVDPSQLTTALINLALNARDAMPDGGKLMLETRNQHLDEFYAKAQTEVRPGPYVMIAVSDTGHGIPAAIRDRVFDPFFTTKDPGKGTGLGLSMVYGFVKQSGGHIKIYSEEGHGTTIKLYLPRADEQADALGSVQRSVAIEGGSETILVVEDDALVRSSVAAHLHSLGYTTHTAANAMEALTFIDGGTPFDLLFTDVIMPGAMNGRQLADEAVRRLPALRVLFTSGYTETAIVHHGRLDPGVLLLAKPYRKSDLARMVRTALTTGAGL
ncbi:MAG TPA: PAS domain S-box protein [Xanthobacteraceae bacterium]